MIISMIIHDKTEALITELVKPSGINFSTNSGINTVVVNKINIDTRIDVLYFRQTRVS